MSARITSGVNKKKKKNIHNFCKEKGWRTLKKTIHTRNAVG
jgi:hypothetical protein